MEQACHDGVACDGDPLNPLQPQCLEQPACGVQHRRLHPRQAAIRGIHDPRDDIVAEAALRIIAARDGEHLALPHLDGGQRRRADVDRDDGFGRAGERNTLPSGSDPAVGGGQRGGGDIDDGSAGAEPGAAGGDIRLRGDRPAIQQQRALDQPDPATTAGPLAAAAQIEGDPGRLQLLCQSQPLLSCDRDLHIGMGGPWRAPRRILHVVLSRRML